MTKPRSTKMRYMLCLPRLTQLLKLYCFIPGSFHFKTMLEGCWELFETTTYKLDEEYDCNAANGLYQFLKSLLTVRAEEFGWDKDNGRFLRVGKDANNPLGNTESLIEHYGTIPVERTQEKWEVQYLSVEVRPAQDVFMMHECLMDSISKTDKDKVMMWKDEYTIIGGWSSGNFLLKIVIYQSLTCMPLFQASAPSLLHCFGCLHSDLDATLQSSIDR